MADKFWLRDASVTDPARLGDALGAVITLLRQQPRTIDGDGALSWAADWLEKRLEEDTTDG